MNVIESRNGFSLVCLFVFFDLWFFGCYAVVGVRGGAEGVRKRFACKLMSGYFTDLFFVQFVYCNVVMSLLE